MIQINQAGAWMANIQDGGPEIARASPGFCSFNSYRSDLEPTKADPWRMPAVTGPFGGGVLVHVAKGTQRVIGVSELR